MGRIYGRMKVTMINIVSAAIVSNAVDTANRLEPRGVERSTIQPHMSDCIDWRLSFEFTAPDVVAPPPPTLHLLPSSPDSYQTQLNLATTKTDGDTTARCDGGGQTNSMVGEANRQRNGESDWEKNRTTRNH